MIIFDCGFFKEIFRSGALALSAALLICTPSFAQIPENSVVIGDKAYHVSLAFDSEYDLQIGRAFSDNPGTAFLNIGSGWKNLVSGESLAEFNLWPEIEYIDSEGFVTLYSSKNSGEIQSSLKWSVSNEILIDGPDGDPSSDNYILLKFSKPLASADYSSAVEYADVASGSTLLVNGQTGIANIAVVEWHPETPDCLYLYLSGAANLPSPSTISFKLKSGAVSAADGSSLSDEYLQIARLVRNSHYGE